MGNVCTGRIRALPSFPLIANGGLIGNLMLYYKRPHMSFNDELQVAQAIFASQVALASNGLVAEAAFDATNPHRTPSSIANPPPVGRCIPIWLSEPEGAIPLSFCQWALLKSHRMRQGKVFGKKRDRGSSRAVR